MYEYGGWNGDHGSCFDILHGQLARRIASAGGAESSISIAVEVGCDKSAFTVPDLLAVTIFQC